MADQFLSPNDRPRLAKVISEVWEIQQGPAARFGLLDKAGLRQFAPALDLAQAPNILAGLLIGRLEPYGMLPRQPNYHALGALINYILQQPDTEQPVAVFLAELLVKYQLIADPAYLNELRSRYGVDVTPQREVDPAALPPTLPPDLPEEPAFEPMVGDQEALEKIINSVDNFLDVDLLAGAIYSAQAVGRIELPRGRGHGTGFLVGPKLVLTNYHVFKSKDVLTSAVMRFDYQADADGVASQGRVFEFDPDFYQGSPDTKLDYALVRLKEEPLGDRKMQSEDEGASYQELLRRGSHRGYLLIAPNVIVEQERVNIIQHPGGREQKVVLTQNYVLHNMTADRVHYLADTEPGSSGSPVLNRRWEVVALHHSGGPHPPPKAGSALQNLLRGNYKFNEGIPLRAILPEIERFLPRK
jgi:V8-like Glu-specific endopeptidase